MAGGDGHEISIAFTKHVFCLFWVWDFVYVCDNAFIGVININPSGLC